MALDRDNLRNDLRDVFVETKNSQSGEVAALDAFADGLAGVIVKHVKTLKINYANGLAAPNGAVAGTFNHTVE